MSGAANADITIRVGGSSAATIDKRATALDHLAMSLLKVNSAMASSPAVANRYAVAANRVATGAKKMGNAANTASNQTNHLRRSLTATGNALDNFGTMFSRMLRIMSTYFIITQVVRVFREFFTMLVDAPTKMELWNTQLRVLSGSMTLAAKRMELLKDVAIETPMELPDLLEGLTSLVAFDVEISERTLPLLTDLAAVSGRAFTEVAQAIGKVIKGSPQAITRSLPVLAIDPNEFKRMREDLGSASEAIWQIIERDFKGFAKESATTVRGIFSNIKDAYFVIMSEAGQGAMDALRGIAQATMDWLQELRRSPQELARFRSNVRLITDDLMSFGKLLISVAKGVNTLANAVGGLGRVIQVLIAIGFIKMAWSMGVALAAMNPLTAMIAAMVPLMALLWSKINEGSTVQRKMTLDQRAFSDELARTNANLERNIMLVDAQARARQANVVHGWGVGLMEASADPTGKDFASRMRGAQMIAGQLPGPLAGEASGAIRQISALTTAIENLDRLEREHGTLTAQQRTLYNQVYAERASSIMKLVDTFKLASATMFAESLKIDRLSLEGIAGVEPPELDVDELKPFTGKWFKDLVGLEDRVMKRLQESMLRMSREVTGFAGVEELKARVLVGLDTPEVMEEELAGLRERLRDLIQEYLESGDPMQIEVAMSLASDLESITDSAKDISDALESQLRSALQRASEGIAEALAGVIDGGGIKALGNAFASVLDMFGTFLIQIGSAKLVTDELVNRIVKFIPGGAVAAIAMGVALKAFAKTMAANAFNTGIGGGGGGYSSPSGASSGPVSYPSFTPSQWGASSAGASYNIYALDPKSFKQFLSERGNEMEFGRAVARVAKEDRNTGGSAYGLIPALAR